MKIMRMLESVTLLDVPMWFDAEDQDGRANGIEHVSLLTKEIKKLHAHIREMKAVKSLCPICGEQLWNFDPLRDLIEDNIRRQCEEEEKALEEVFLQKLSPCLRERVRAELREGRK